MARKPTYEAKFADFIEMCANAERDKVSYVLVSHPEVLGDSYDEIVESLARLAEANLSLRIAGRQKAE